MVPVAKLVLRASMLPVLVFMAGIQQGCDVFTAMAANGYVAPDMPYADVMDAGIYPPTGTAIAEPDAALGEASVVFEDPPPPIEETRTIPAEVGVVFGFRFEVVDWLHDDAWIRFRIIHPPINGDTETLQERAVATDALLGAFYSIGSEAEVEATGTWRIQIEHDDDVLAAREFTLE